MKKIFVLILTNFIFILLVKAQAPGDEYAISENFITLKPYNTFTDIPIVDPKVGIIQARRGDLFTIQTTLRNVGGVNGYYIIFFPFDKQNQQEKKTSKIQADYQRNLIDSKEKI